jgi:MYXO-CTERM domain-containing protein/uncharacterized repeat protein (TIGR01451 family)
MFSHSRAQHSETHAGGISMRLLKYIPRIACAAILLLGTFAATPALAQPTTVNMTVSLSGGGIIDFGSTGYLQVRLTVPAGAGDAHNVRLNGFFTPGNSLPTASLSGFGSGANGGNCVTPDPATPTNANSFQCTIGEIINGTTPLPNLPNSDANLQRRIVISQPAPSSRPTTCPPTEHAGDFTVTVTSQNAPPVTINRPGHDTEDFADLSVSMSGPGSANVGDTARFNVTITNFGPCPAENICASNANAALGLVFVSNTGDCTRPFGTCDIDNLEARHRPPNTARYNPSAECGFSTSTTAPGGTLNPGQSFNFTSTYTIDVLARSVTSVGDTNEVDIVSDTNIVNYGASHTQSALTDTIVQNDTSCSVAGTGGSSIAVVGLVVLVAYALNRRRRS